MVITEMSLFVNGVYSKTDIEMGLNRSIVVIQELGVNRLQGNGKPLLQNMNGVVY